MKKAFILVLSIIFLLSAISLISAQEYKIDISTIKNTFEAGEDIIFKVSLLDSNNNPINDVVTVVLEDAEKIARVEQEIISNQFVNITLGDKASYGQGKIIARYKNIETTGFFIIEIKEMAKFDIVDDKLTITNTGNTRYTKTIQIKIGETTSTKSPKINAGESVSYILIAPKGEYDVVITDGKTTLTKSGVVLSGTGKIVGALDESVSERSGITGGISPDEESDEQLLSYLRKSKFTYVFILVIFGAAILLAIERKFRKV